MVVNRDAKIKLIKNLVNGRITINDLEPGKVWVFVLKNGYYETGKEKLSKTEFDALCKTRPNNKCIILEHVKYSHPMATPWPPHNPCTYTNYNPSTINFY